IHGKPAAIIPTWNLTCSGLMSPPVTRLTLALLVQPLEKRFIGPRLPEGWQPVAVEASAAGGGRSLR
uniref:hypothetical protein n=1 Tax=uncultured Brevundimonas sp. TaxID=213418 RepID=UPI00261B9835